MEESTVIPLSKKKILLLLIASFGFVAVAYWMLQMDAAEIETQRRFNSPLLVHGIGLVGVVFFAACGLVMLRKLFDNKPGLVLSPSGMLDNSSGMSAGFVPWTDILGFGEWNFQKQRILVVMVTKPHQYITGGFIRRKLKQTNFNMVGSPVTISANAIKIDFDELQSLCAAYLKKYGEPTEATR